MNKETILKLNKQGYQPLKNSSSDPFCSQTESSTKKRTSESTLTDFTDYKSINEYQIEEVSQKELPDIKNIEVNLDDLPETAQPLVKAVIDFVDSGAIAEMARKYILDCDEENLQQRIGIYHATGLASMLFEKNMDDQHRAVFIAILNTIHNKDEKIQKTILEPIADAILESPLSFISFTKLNMSDNSKCFEVESITKKFFAQAHHLTQKDEYLPYIEANGDRALYYQKQLANRHKQSPVFNGTLSPTPWYIDLLYRGLLQSILTLFIVIIILKLPE